jgi:hypothetical protein
MTLCRIIEGLAPSVGIEQDPADAISEKPGPRVSKSGDWWELGEHRLLCGDALDPINYARLMSDQLASVIFTDPPYNVPIPIPALSLTHTQMFLSSSYTAAPASRSSPTCRQSIQIKWIAPSRLDRVRRLQTLRRKSVNSASLISPEAIKKSPCLFLPNPEACPSSLYRSQHEFILVFKQGKGSHRNNVQLGQFGRYRTNVWQYPGASSFSRSTGEGNLLALHPTVKPVALVADAIVDCSARGDIVLDPFLGSGTTVIAAERTGRICYAIELDPKYVDRAVRRWQTFTGLAAEHGVSGDTFNELEKRAGNEQKH